MFSLLFSYVRLSSCLLGLRLGPTKVRAVEHFNEPNDAIHHVEHEHASGEVVHEVVVVWSPPTVWSGSGVETRAEGVSTTAGLVSFKFFDGVRKVESAISDERHLEDTASPGSAQLLAPDRSRSCDASV